MSIFKRGGKGNYYMQFDYRGKTYIKSSRTANRRQAERMEREWRAEVHAMEEMGERSRITLKEALGQYEKQKQRTGDGSYKCRSSAILDKYFPTHLKIDEIKEWHLAKFKTAREIDGAAAQTIKHNFQAIRNAWSWAKDNGFMVKTIEYPKIKIDNKRLRVLSYEEEKQLLVELDPMRSIRNRPVYEKRPITENMAYQDNLDLVVILIDTGARYGEIATLSWDRVDLDNGVISLWRPKVRNESIIYMTSRVRETLERRRDESKSEYVFTNKKGGPRGHATKGIKMALKRAGIDDIRIHDFRHTCASRLIRNGMSLYEVGSILGHTDVQTTQRYAHLERTDVGRRARDIIEYLNRGGAV